MACANIEYDKDIIKYVNVRRTTKYETTHFFEAVRAATGAPDWMITVDSRKTKILHNGACIQYLVHFKGTFYHNFIGYSNFNFFFDLGAIANELESDFSKLLAVGYLHEQTLKISGYYPTNVKLKIPYQGCPVYNKKLASSKFWDLLNFAYILSFLLYLFVSDISSAGKWITSNHLMLFVIFMFNILLYTYKVES